MEKKQEMSEEDINKIIKDMNVVPQSETKEIDTIVKQIDEGRIKLNPEYQRKYILDNKKASRFIESILLTYIIPEVQLFKERVNSELIDGQQRLTAVYNFRKNLYKLTGLEIAPKLNGYTYDDLSDSMKELFNSYKLNCRITNRNKNSDKMYKVSIFNRLNKGSKPLIAQEIRNCVYCNYDSLKFVRKLAEEYKDMFFKNFNIKNNRGYLIEFFARLLYRANNYPNYNHSMDKDVEKFLSEGKVIPLEKQNEYRKKVKRIFTLINDYIGFETYKNKNNNIIISDVEATFIILYNQDCQFYNIKDNISDIKVNLANLINKNTDYIAVSMKGQTSLANYIIEKIKLQQNIILPLIKKLDSKRTFSQTDKNILWNNNKLLLEKSVDNNTHICNICNNEIFDKKSVEVDHIIPWSKGGRTILDNAQLVHSTCNKYKGNKI